MRKLWLSLLAISFFICTLSGCETQIAVQPNLSFTADCSVKVNDYDLVLNVISSDTENVSVEVVSPDNLQGLTYERVNSTLYIDYKGLRCNTSSDYLTKFNPFQILIDVLSSAKTTELEYILEDKGCVVYKGLSESGEYMLFVAKDTGEIKKVKPMYAQYEYEFI